MTEETYTNRYIEPWIVKEIHDGAITNTDGWTTGVPADLAVKLSPGDVVVRESLSGPLGQSTGWRLNGEWYARRSDQQIEADRQKWRADREREDRERLEANRPEWVGRTENLPPWLQERIQHFREKGGENFDLQGWGYELAIAELAVLYDKHPEVTRDTKWDDLPQDIRELDLKLGCSGNQHGMAVALANAHRAGQSLAGTVSALSPITGDAFYEGEKS